MWVILVAKHDKNECIEGPQKLNILNCGGKTNVSQEIALCPLSPCEKVNTLSIGQSVQLYTD